MDMDGSRTSQIRTTEFSDEKAMVYVALYVQLVSHLKKFRSTVWLVREPLSLSLRFDSTTKQKAKQLVFAASPGPLQAFFQLEMVFTTGTHRRPGASTSSSTG